MFHIARKKLHDEWLPEHNRNVFARLLPFRQQELIMEYAGKYVVKLPS